MVSNLAKAPLRILTLALYFSMVCLSHLNYLLNLGIPEPNINIKSILGSETLGAVQRGKYKAPSTPTQGPPLSFKTPVKGQQLGQGW